MTRRPVSRSALATVLAVLLALGSLLVNPSLAQAADSTSAVERARVDRVPTPVLDWQPCDLGECARVTLPLDYDEPRGGTVEVALTRIRARVPGRRIGSLFLNPGGPGASGTTFPQRAQAWLGADVLDRFDLIGMDPRGTNQSTTTQCFGSPRRAAEVTGTLLGMGFPVSRSEESTFLKAARALATSCSGHGARLASAMSTAQVARDMDVVRRAVGDDKLTYLGFSYGTYLGQVYANLFPDRVRAIAIDGVVDPLAWVGTPATASTPISVRLDAAPASSAALAELLRRCAASGACPLAEPEASFAAVAEQLRAEPLVLTDPDAGEWTLTYQQFVTTVLYALYTEQGVEEVPFLVATLAELQAGQASPDRRVALTGAYRRSADAAARKASRTYPNELEVVPVVLCSDSRNPVSPAAWSARAAAEDARAPYFGRHWLWGSVYCAGQHWRVRDEDAYTGRFDAVPSRPLLVVGNTHDPATSYAAARSASRILRGSRLLSSDNWGHTAYGVSACVTRHVDRYLVGGTLPASGTWCRDGRQPFAG